MTPTENPETGYGSYLKAGILKHPVIVKIDDRKVEHNATVNGPVLKAGDFGNQVVIPMTISGIPKRVATTTKGSDYANLRKHFGEDMATWIGREIQIGNDPNLANLVRIAPVVHGAPIA